MGVKGTIVEDACPICPTQYSIVPITPFITPHNSTITPLQKTITPHSLSKFTSALG